MMLWRNYQNSIQLVRLYEQALIEHQFLVLNSARNAREEQNVIEERQEVTDTRRLRRAHTSEEISAEEFYGERRYNNSMGNNEGENSFRGSIESEEEKVDGIHNGAYDESSKSDNNPQKEIEAEKDEEAMDQTNSIDKNTNNVTNT